MSNLSKLFSLVSDNESLKSALQSATTFTDIKKVASEFGLQVEQSDFAALIKQHTDAISANVAGIDGNGSLVFGRDWAYPGPDVDGRFIG